MPETLLVVDDEPSMREFLEIMLTQDGYIVRSASSGEEGLELFKVSEPSLVLTDVRMPGMSGLDLIQRLKQINPTVPVMVITAFASAEDALRAVREGAYDYLSKPFQLDDLRIIIRNALEVYRLRRENLELKRSVEEKFHFREIIGKSSQMQSIFKLILKVAPSNAGILITGESGTGKELIAKSIHHHSSRADKPFVTVNCAAIPENLLESEMFGHVRGAFTGAVGAKIGLVEMAHTGTLFLDEIGEIPLSIQVKLLRFLQEREFRRVGDTEDKKIDRPEDIPLLTEYFLNKYASAQHKQIQRVSSLSMRVLCNYAYPGNIRELENIIERCVTLEESDQLTAENLPPKLFEKEPAIVSVEEPDIGSDGIDLEKALESTERQLITRALEIAGNNRSKAATLLGISFRSFRYRLIKLGMAVDETA